jgi:hypothetical protein
MFTNVHKTVSSVFALVTFAGFVLLIGCSGKSPLAPVSETGTDRPGAEKASTGSTTTIFDIPEDEDMGQEDVGDDQLFVKPALGSNKPVEDDQEGVPSNVGYQDFDENIAEVDRGD